MVISPAIYGRNGQEHSGDELYAIIYTYVMLTPHTLNSPVLLEGIGLHTGARCRVEVHPRSGGGRVFLRDGVAIPALVDYVAETRRCTTLAHAGASVSTVEHLLAACLLAGVDHAEIRVDGPEIPALDGCGAAWYAALMTAGVCQAEGEVTEIRVPDAQWISDGDSDFFLCPAAGLTAYAAIAFPGTVAEHMLAGGPVAEAAVRTQILRARTFALEHEVRALLDAGLAQGGSLETAVVLTADGYLNAEVWPHEPAWHKVLDLLGDLALVGARLAGHILAVRGGHRSHVALARRLRSALTSERQQH